MTNPPSVRAVPPRPRSPDGRPAVLVVEAASDAPDSAADLVRRLGYRVTGASGMLAGLAAVRETQFGVVMLELQTAHGEAADGWKQWRAGRSGAGAFASASDTPAIALTRADDGIDHARLRELGFDDHLARPLRASQVREMLNRHLRPAAAVAPDSASQAAGSTDVLDAEALARLAELDPSGAGRLVERVLQAFQTSAARLRPQALVARQVGDRKSLRLIAHTLKSSSAAIGAMRLSRICAEIETAIRTDSGEDLSPKLDAMDASLDIVLQAIAMRPKDPP